MNEQSPADRDEEWLLANWRGPRITDEDVDAFVERVAIKMAQGVSEVTARAQALHELRERLTR